MTNQYTYGESYYLYASEDLLNTALPDGICHVYSLPLGTLLKDAVWLIFETADNRKIITLQLNVGEFKELNDVSDYINEQDFNSALVYYSNYGITEFMTLSEFKKIELKQESII